MKKIFALAAMALVAISVNAQGWFAGGTLNAWRDVTDNKTEFTIMPEFGYNFNDSWALATGIGYQHLYNDGKKSNIFRIDPYARWTFARVSIVGFFVDGGVGVGFGKSKVGDVSSKTATIWHIGFQPGISVNVNEKVSLVAKFGILGYEGANKHAKAVGFADGGGLRLSGDALSFGFYYNF